MQEAVIAAVTKPSGRKSLYHFTRGSNLPAIAYFDTLWSSGSLDPYSAGARRSEPKGVKHGEHSITLSAHLRIADVMIDPSTTQEQFRACLDRHVFFWPTLPDCRKMMDTYARREPDEGFAVLEFDAYSLLSAFYAAAKLSKYDSGSSPRYPAHCSYRKSSGMFLPLDSFQRVTNPTVPAKASEIREVLIEDQVTNVSKHLRAVYADPRSVLPECWLGLAKPLDLLQKKP